MSKQYKVFLVDDDVKTLIMIKYHLEKKLGHKLSVNVFAYGENCLDRVEELQPDIVVLDYYLNAIKEDAQTGMEILKKILLLKPDTRVIMLSGQEDMTTALETIHNGANDYVVKNEKSMQNLELAMNKIIHADQQAALADNNNADAPKDKHKIFLVDDDIKTLIMIKHHLEKKLGEKIDVSIFAYGENSLDRLEELQPDIVVLDYYLNAIKEDAQTGVEILKKIKATKYDTRVIMLSGQEDMETAMETILNGASDYVVKNEKSLQNLELAVSKIIYADKKETTEA